jgi:hypothetical protein
MAKYICSECYKETENGQMPEYCPSCGAEKNSLQELKEDTINDEMAVTMGNLRLLLKLLDSYVEKVKSVNADFQSKLDAVKKTQADQLKNCNDKHEQEKSRLEYERSNVLEKWEKEYKNTLSSQSRRAEAYKNEQDNISSNSRKYRDDIQHQVESGKKHIEKVMSQVKTAEAHILPKKYHKMIKSKPQTVEVSVTSLSAISAMNPQQLANDLNTLNEKFIRRIIKSAEITRKFIEFYSMRVKAEELYQKELTELNNMIPDSDSKTNKMIAEARRRFNMQMSEHEKDAAKNKDAYVKYCAEVNSKYDKERNALLSRQAQQKKDLTTQHERQLADLDQSKKQTLMGSYQALQETVLAKVPPQTIADVVKNQKARSKAVRNNFKPATTEPENVTIGSLEYKLGTILGNRLVSSFMARHYKAIINGNSFVFPFTIGLNQNLCVIFKYSNSHANLAKDHIQTICLNAFLETPPNKMRFHFIDPLKSGQSFAVFKHFEDDLSRSYSVILGGIQTDSAAIEQQLQIVVDHIKTMQVNTFKGQYKNIREYNAANKLNPQPYNIVGIMDFPAGFTAKSVDLLQQIVATGKECGVYAIVMSNTDNIATADTKIKGQIKNIEDSATVYTLKEKGYNIEINGEIDENMIFIIDKPLNIKTIIDIAPIMKKGITDAGRIIIDYRHIAPKTNKHFSFSSDEGLVIPIGMSGASDIQYLTLGRPGSQSVHALICGQIGSGKSRLLHAIITSSILQYSNNELEIYLVDFKSGTEFKIYADYILPNFKVIAIESEQEFGLSVLQYIMKESDRRAQLFNGCSKSDITAYNSSPEAVRSGKLPRILVVIDEFHELFNSANADVSTEASRLLDNILRLKRSFGVHVILCTQSVRGLNEVNEAAMAQIAVRIALKCPREDAEVLLGSGSDAIAQIEDNDAGSAVYLPAISTPKTNNKFRVGFISQDAHKNILKSVEDHYAAGEEIKWDTRVLISDVADSRDSVFQEYLKRNKLLTEERKVHFGESLNIDNSLVVSFETRKNENMLLAGKNAQKAHNLLFFITLDLVLQKIKAFKSSTPPAKIYVFNFNDLNDSIIQDKLQDMVMLLPDYIEGATSDDAQDRLEEVYNLYKTKTNSQESIWIIISNFGLATDFQNTIYSSTCQGFAMLDEILRKGPQKGVFTIGWHDDLTLFSQKYPNMLELYKKRIAFNLGDEEALHFADVVKDPSINKNNAIYAENGRGKQKFRPYATPGAEWFTELIDKISSEAVEL